MTPPAGTAPGQGPDGLRQRLTGGGIHLMDGAMGTVLYDRGVFVNVCYDELNLTRPELVEDVHRQYAEAGARILETNTFGANPVKLSSHGLEARTAEINRAAVDRVRGGIARARLPAGTPPESLHVVGAMGPLGIRIEPWGPTAEAEARSFFARQVEGLLEGGVDGFVLETFSDLRELEQALRAVRELSTLPVVAQVTIESDGRTSYGTGVAEAARRLEALGADAVGLNCSVGPAEVLDAVEIMVGATSLPVSALPNAGLPRSVGDRKIYMASPEYMARYARRMAQAGARLLGGCCGTTPEHIRQMAGAVASLEVDRGANASRSNEAHDVSGAPGPVVPSSPLSRRVEPSPLADRSPLGRRLSEGTFLSSIELVPPSGWDPAPLLAAARRARLAGVDVVAIPDAPRGRARMASLPAATLVERETGLDVVAHYACRDRNMVGMISDLLAAASTGIRNVLVVTGDRSPAGPYPDHTALLDIDSIGLVNVLHHLNHGVDPGGHPVEPPTPFVIGVALGQHAPDLERELRRFRWKVAAGAEFAVTQPVFEAEAVHRILDRAFAADGPAEGAPPIRPIPVMAGLWPVASVRTAEFLHHELPGVHVPDSVMERMGRAEAEGPERAREEGISIAVEAARALRGRIAGIHVSCSAGEVEMALEVVRRLRQAPGAASASEAASEAAS
ncbi:MAG: bifunctional homocysteine S-methyltransferase/methylenetetrahydrofolate reductase [Gemmatimonadales bacterium]|nr:MAG: bifunctional homocysteine S-methyltransferase/methylenetetrahydrofolate reductase [Gemmatimonadales bacterium]